MLCCCIFQINGRNCLWPNEQLHINNCLISADYPSVFTACYQEDGRLCVFGDQTATWCTDSSHSNSSHAAFDSTGSLNFYDMNGEVYYTLYQSTSPSDDYFLFMQSNGNLILYQYSENSLEVEERYQCQDEGCETISCDDCDPSPQCYNNKNNNHSSHKEFPLTIVLCIGFSIVTLISIRVIHCIFYGVNGSEGDKLEIDDLPTLATIEVHPRSHGEYERVVDILDVKIIQEDIEDIEDMITADCINQCL